MLIPDWLLKLTFRVEYSPNCSLPFLVRLVGKGRGMIDGLPYIGDKTDDALGFGATIEEAAEAARDAREGAK